MDEKIIVGKETKRVVSDDYIVARVTPDGYLIVQGTGVNTNPRKYEKDHGIVTLPVLSGPTPIWAVGIAALNPVGGRTAGLVTTVYTLIIENSTGAAVTAWLEDNLGVPITPPFHIANNDSIVIPLDAGGNFGDMDLYFNASVALVSCQLFGTEE